MVSDRFSLFTKFFRQWDTMGLEVPKTFKCGPCDIESPSFGLLRTCSCTIAMQSHMKEILLSLTCLSIELSDLRFSAKN